MKVRWQSASLALLLLSALPSSVAESPVLDALSAESSPVTRDIKDIPPPKNPSPEGNTKSVPKGTYDAPVDGKDGKPHAGPFVETSAERDRKKTLGSDEVPSSKTPAKEKPLQLGSDGKPIPQSNDGVMNDAGRLGPKEGTRGTEGGVSEKAKDAKLGAEKTPDSPKDLPPLPPSVKGKTPAGTEQGTKSESIIEDDRKLLQKPNDLPSKPHDIPPPKAPGSSVENTLHVGSEEDKAAAASLESIRTGNEIISPMHSLVLSFTMILFSEVGDKTFLVAALMAMRHPRLLVFSAAFSALITMTILSAVLGHAVPTLIPKSFTNFAAAGLFLVFGLKMFKEAREMAPDEGVGEEMREVEMELEEKEQQQARAGRRRSSISPYALESGRGSGPRKSRSSAKRFPSPPESLSSASSRETSPVRGATLSNVMAGLNNLCSLLLSPAWVSTFVMTFLGEWGDRSQIATIAMAAGQDYWWVTCGAIMGHAICTAAAVIGGKAIAGRVSMRVVTLGGAVAFFIFGLIYLFEAIY